MKHAKPCWAVVQITSQYGHGAPCCLSVHVNEHDAIKEANMRTARGEAVRCHESCLILPEHHETQKAAKELCDAIMRGKKLRDTPSLYPWRAIDTAMDRLAALI